MLLPQSSAFAALKNRLNSVSAIGYLHISRPPYVNSSFNHLRQKSSETGPPSNPPGPAASTFGDRSTRLKAREDAGVKWVELLDKFKATQERARRSQRIASMGEDLGASPIQEKEQVPQVPPKNQNVRPNSASSTSRPLPLPAQAQVPGHKPRSSLSNLGRFAGGVAGRKKK
jgi:vacuole morphology and inheritance protein 14